MNERAGTQALTRRVNAQWRGNLRAELTVRDCPPFVSDEPAERGGLFEYPTPAEYMLGALAGCAAAHVEMFAAQVGMPLADCRVEARLTMERFAPGDAHAVNGGVSGVELEVHLTSSGSAEELEEVKGLFRAGCILYLFMSAAASVQDAWFLHEPA